MTTLSNNGAMKYFMKQADQHNDHSEWSARFDACRESVAGFIAGWVKNPQDQYDILQDTFYLGFCYRTQLKNTEKLLPWLKTIAKRQCIRFLQSYHLENQQELIEDSWVSPFPEPEQQWVYMQGVEEIRNTLSLLTNEYRIPLVLYYLEDASIKTIAEQMDLSVNAVKKRLQRGRKKLKTMVSKSLKEDYETESTHFSESILEQTHLSKAMQQAALLGQMGLVEAMMMDGINVNEPDINGRTLLHWAAESGNKEMAKQLIRYGADILTKDKMGMIPADCAKRSGNRNLLYLLEIEND